MIGKTGESIGRKRERRITVCFDDAEYERIVQAVGMEKRTASAIVRELVLSWADRTLRKK